MTEQDHSNLPAGNCKDTEKSGDEFMPEDTWPVCLRCFKPCHPLQNYCDNCDSDDAINPLTPYMGFVNIRFNYGIFCTMLRKICYDKQTSIARKLLYLLLIVVFIPVMVPIMLIIGLPLFLISKVRNPRLRKITTTAFFILLLLLLMVYLFYSIQQTFHYGRVYESF